MKTTVARVADPIELEGTEKPVQQVQPLELSLQQVADRALTKTEVLTDILERQERSYVRHWGIND